MCWISNDMQHKCNKYATQILMICMGRFQRNLGTFFLCVSTSGVTDSEYTPMMLASIEIYLLDVIARQCNMSKIATQSANDSACNMKSSNLINRIYKLLNVEEGIYFLGQSHYTGVFYNFLDKYLVNTSFRQH